MFYEEIDPKTAHRLLTEDDHVYVDVRSEDEFTDGHPEGAVNIPIFHFGPGGMVPNPKFLDTMRALFDTRTPLLMGCRSGGRSARACQFLAEAGYTKLYNVAGGFLGGELPGWKELDLPTSTETETSSWAAMQAKANDKSSS